MDIQEECIRPQIRISVRNLVEFLMRSGNIDNRRFAGGEMAMAEGSRLHRVIQKRMGANYQAEVSISQVITMHEFDLSLEGRIDGVITEVELGREEITIDEIKTTYRELSKIKQANPTHLAQAKCYASMYGRQKELESIRIQMTYCNIESEEIKYFHEEYQMDELSRWFHALLSDYQRWANLEFVWKKLRKSSSQEMSFPFPYRDGQKELLTYVYQTIYHSRKLFMQAPTGVGKTISTLFPALKAMGEEKVNRIFYLTAKTITRTVAVQTLDLLRKQGLRCKSVVLTAKEKICFLEEAECNPVACSYACGHYDRINNALYHILTSEEVYSAENIRSYAMQYKVCPFEMALDITLFSDCIICDYNYLFDPHVSLKRFFAEGIHENNLFLVDEAHNLLDRGREMYSASLKKEDFLALHRILATGENKWDKTLSKRLNTCNKEMLAMKRECEGYSVLSSISTFWASCSRLFSVMDEYLQEYSESPFHKEVLEFYFEISHFLLIYEKLDESYVIYSEIEENGVFKVKLFCIDPAKNLKECMEKGRSSILFSATLLPIQFYKRLLGGEEEDYEVYAQSNFDSRKRLLLMASDVTSKYSRRSQDEFYKIALYIEEIIKNRHGNYMIFFPSYAFMKTIYDIYRKHFGVGVDCILQENSMTETEREEFLNRFQHGSVDGIDQEHSLLGFCVLGGIFGEGIDLKEDSLIGVIIVGTGLPLVCCEREIMKDYFLRQGENGFDYSYRYPGMNKVLQAAGRVIRTHNDVGIIALLDERFQQPSYQRLFPREWEEYKSSETSTIARQIERFWDEWL